MKEFLRKRLTGGQVRDLHGAAIQRITDEQDAEVRGFGVAIDAGLREVLGGEGLDIQGENVRGGTGRRRFRFFAQRGQLHSCLFLQDSDPCRE